MSTAVPALIAAAALGSSLLGCGGGVGGKSATPLVVVSMQFADADGVPILAPAVQDVPRNARLMVTFSSLLRPETVDEQSIKIRYGPSFSSAAAGMYRVYGQQVLFDPTVTAAGVPRPFGLPASTQFQVTVESVPSGGPTVVGVDGDVVTAAATMSFATGVGWLHETVPPRLLSATFVPSPLSGTGEIPADATLALTFSEAILPDSVRLSVSSPGPDASDTIDLRYVLGTETLSAGIVGHAILAVVTQSAAADTLYLTPSFTFGDRKYTFAAKVLLGLEDLARNPIGQAVEVGPFVCDGTGAPPGRLLAETFIDRTDAEPTVDDAPWGTTDAGFLVGAPMTTRRVYVTGAKLEAASPRPGGYFASPDPLTGKALNQYIPAIVPPTSMGRRAMWSFPAAEMGSPGAVSSVEWGPDSNATFGAQYPRVIVRLGYQVGRSESLGSTFSGNYRGDPVVVYDGPYSVVQRANVGNQFPAPPNQSGLAANQPLYDYTGFVPWPAPQSYFEWRDVDSASGSSNVFLLDVSAEEGNTWQQMRGWFGFAPGGGGQPPQWLIALRHLYSTFEGDTPNPQGAVTTSNPEGSICDTAFTIVKRTSLAQSRFLTPDPVDPAGNAYLGPFSSQPTYGTRSDYRTPVLSPPFSAAGTEIVLEFQGATALVPTSDRTAVDTTQPFTPWTTHIDDCDGFPYIRWRATLHANLVTGALPRLDSLVIPVGELPVP